MGQAPASLQKLHDGAIEARTSLTLAKEREEEEQRLADFKLERESQRATQQKQLEMDRCQHELKLKCERDDCAQKQLRQAYELEMERLREIKKIDPNSDIGAYLIAKEC